MLTAPVSKPQESPLPDPVPPSASSAATGIKAGLSRYWQLGALVMTSALVHGLLLAIPLPEAPETEEPEPDEIEIIQEQAMNVARLPQVAVPEETPPAAAAGSAEPARQPPQTQAPQTQAPQNRPQASQPSQRPPRPEDLDQQPDPLSQVEQLPSGGGDNSSGSNQELGLQERLETPSAYVKEGSAVSISDFSFNQVLIDWTQKLQDDGNSPAPKIDKPYLTFEIEYQLDACQHPFKEGPPQTGYLGVVVDANNTILSEVDILGTSEYPILDAQAKDELGNHLDGLPARTQNTAYLVEFNVNYNSCP